MLMKSGCLPLLDCFTVTQTIEVLYDAIVAEATTIEFYRRLLIQAPDELHKEFIDEAMQEEINHLEIFTHVYRHYTGHMPQYMIIPVEYKTYKEGLLIALKDELEAADFYKEVQLSTTDALVVDSYYYAMVDELEHGTMFSTLYNSI